LVESRAAAVELADHRWPVHPGTFLLPGGRRWAGREDTMGLEPVSDSWWRTGVVDPECAFTTWSRAPYSVLVTCGKVIDAIAVTELHGLRAIEPLREVRSVGPIVAGPDGTWLMLTKPGVPLRPELLARKDIQLHTAGSWIPLPPTGIGRAPYRWAMSPQLVNWTVPSAQLVQQALIDTALPPSLGRPWVSRTSASPARAATSSAEHDPR
jgi:hypothetical protein